MAELVGFVPQTRVDAEVGPVDLGLSLILDGGEVAAIA